MSDLVTYIVVGFIAQMIDGCLGMAYGVSSTTFLLSVGVSPKLASASVHTAEVFTTGVSGLSHWGFGNVNGEVVKKLLIPGVIGGIIGAYLLTTIPDKTIKPIVDVYLMLMGGRILLKALSKSRERREPMQRLELLGFSGGFLDAIGGGGWGPVVTTTLVANGHEPRFAIGSVNLAEFFVTLAQSITFFVVLGKLDQTIVGGLILGGVVAAPMAAYLSKRLEPKKLMVLVGVVIIGLSLRTLVLALLA